MKNQLLIIAFCTLVSAPSIASEFYILGDLGKSKFETNFDGAAYLHKEDSFSVGGGYKFNNALALEFVYRDLGSNSNSARYIIRHGSDMFSDVYYEKSSKQSLDTFNISMVTTLPIGEAASIYGRLGIGRIKYKFSYSYYSEEIYGENYYAESGSGSELKDRVLAGIGLQYTINASFALRAEYSQYQKWEDSTIYSTTIGLTYQF